MRSVLASLALVAAWLPLPSVAMAESAPRVHRTVVTLEAPVAVPISSPLRDRFGMGAMPSLSVAVPAGQWMLVGLRVRGGFLSNGPPPTDPDLKDSGTGGLALVSALIRVRPLGGRYPDSRALGLWGEIGAGPGLTGTHVRPMGEAAVGWNFCQWGATFGPSLRYLRVVQTGNNFDGADAQIAMAGLEFTLHDAHGFPPPELSAAAQAELALAKAKTSDRDGDGIPDGLDKCPDEPEDKDGFEDEDGCPDPDNDQDGILDASDACPNEPETVNGFKDEDGCPDEVPVAVKADRIALDEHLLFETNRARIRPEARPALAAVFALWKQHPEWSYLVVDGHTDRRGPDDLNIDLSRQRAESAIQVLIGMGFPPEKLRIRAFGRRKPRVPGDSEEADRENRRVEFIIVKKNAPPAQSAEQPPAQPLEPAPVPTPAQEDASPQPDAQTQPGETTP
jgi:outer membrane protein OmpA-like peptidoglycan-associated protein